MTTPTLVRSELGRLTATPLARLAFIALMLVPLMYGGAYLWANRDPYAKLDNIPAAIVNQDDGATSNGSHVNFGSRVVKQAVDGGDFKWSKTSAADARSGLHSGKYDFVVRIPANFSSSLVSGSGTSPKQAEIVMTTADTNSYLASTIAKQAGTAMRDAVAHEVGKTAAKQLLVGLADVRDNLGTAVSGASQLASGTKSAKSGADSLASGTGKLRSGASELASGTASLPSQTSELNDGAQQVAAGAKSLASGLASARDKTAALPAQTKSLASGASEVASGNAQLAKAIDTLAPKLSEASDTSALQQIVSASTVVTAAQKAQLIAELKQLSAAGQSASQLQSAADTLKTGSAAVASGANTLADSAPTLTSGIATAASGANSLASGATQVSSGTAKLASAAPTLTSGAKSLADGTASADTGAKSLASGLSKLSSGASTLHTKLKDGRSDIPASTSSQRNAQASVISNSVKVSNDDVASAGTYGAGLAPFFISLAAWIGMYALFLILKPISKRAITAVRKPFQIALGALATPVVLGVVQMAALYLIIRFALGFGVDHPAGMIGLMVLASAAFAAIIMALNVMLGSVGQFLGLVLMLIQLVTAGGTFPWQTLPGPLAALHFALPMSYAVDGIRQVMYGGSMATAWSDASVLGYWLVGALFVTTLIAARQTRSRTLKDLRPSLIG